MWLSKVRAIKVFANNGRMMMVHVLDDREKIESISEFGGKQMLQWKSTEMNRQQRSVKKEVQREMEGASHNSMKERD